ncbi:hypothetical protein H4R26_001263 [Coemansia thaxteri]|uniref:glucan 1,3-beta-glucosidase n=1 Tax=Coemansia thaxteri TaxID=2663907 RepID=A0A9W8ELB6_9FUNG|nr:hypothetical protein H4R26_001263 [Coemansia thaxteri]
MPHTRGIVYLAVLAAAQLGMATGEPLYLSRGGQAHPYQYANPFGAGASGAGMGQAPIQMRVPAGNPPPRLSSPALPYLPPAMQAPLYAPHSVVPFPNPAVEPWPKQNGNVAGFAMPHPVQHEAIGEAENVNDDATPGSISDMGLPAKPLLAPEFKQPLGQWPIATVDDQTGVGALPTLDDSWPISSENLGNESAASQSPSVSSSNSPAPAAETDVAAISAAPTAHAILDSASAKKPRPVIASVSRIKEQTAVASPRPAISSVALEQTSIAAKPVVVSSLPTSNSNSTAVTSKGSGESDSHRAEGAIRIPADHYVSSALALPTQDVLGDVRQDPGSGMGMGYHGHKMVRGVNIGGFLVPEFWITPSLIASIPDPKPNDYMQLCNRLGPEATLSLMRKHWETWVTEAEIQRLAVAGLTHLRIPIGHWEFVDSDEGYVRGGLPYFKRLVYWANKYSLRVIPDMHTAPGSQNGFDNSGSTSGVNWTKDPRNVAMSKRALQMMLKYIASDPVILATVDAVDLLNEPFIDSLDFDQLWEYDTGGHILISNGLRKVPPVISIVDRGFKEFSWWQSRWPRDWNSKYTDSWLDAHLYHVFDRNIDEWSLENHLRLVCQNGRDLKANSTFFPIIVGEWSLALPQTALRGRENEARRRFAEAQLDAYELGGAGWIFWCFKTEVSPEWSFLEALDRSWIPQPLTNREFQPICTY